MYGGDETTNGTIAFDLTTHSVMRRPMGVFTYANGDVTTEALFDITGANFKLVG